MEKINLEYINNIADGNNDLIKELIEIFISQVPVFISDMNTNYQKQDWKYLSAVAHKAKSSVDIMGLAAMKKKLKRLEIDAQKGINTDEYKEIIDEFIITCENAIIDAQKAIDKL